MLVPLVNTTVVKLFLGIAEIAVVGIVAVVILLQFENASSPMLVTLSGMVTLVKASQLENAELPMLVTESGIVTLVKFLQR